MNKILIFLIIVCIVPQVTSQQLTISDFALSEQIDSSETSTGIKYKSESKAFYMSLLATTVPATAGIIALALDKEKTVYRYDEDGQIVGYYTEYPDEALGSILISFGLIYGPSAGHFYADRPLRALGGMGIRTGSVLVFSIASFAICGWDCDEQDGAKYDIALGVFITGLTISAYSIVYDIVSTKKSVRMYNEKKQKTIISLTPKVNYKTKNIGAQLSIIF